MRGTGGNAGRSAVEELLVQMVAESYDGAPYFDLIELELGDGGVVTAVRPDADTDYAANGYPLVPAVRSAGGTVHVVDEGEAQRVLDGLSDGGVTYGPMYNMDFEEFPVVMDESAEMRFEPGSDMAVDDMGRSSDVGHVEVSAFDARVRSLFASHSDCMQDCPPSVDTSTREVEAVADAFVRDGTGTVVVDVLSGLGGAKAVAESGMSRYPDSFDSAVSDAEEVFGAGLDDFEEDGLVF